jgi:hypothetical protein
MLYFGDSEKASSTRNNKLPLYLVRESEMRPRRTKEIIQITKFL